MSGLRSRIVTLISAARRAGDDLQKALSMKTVRDYDNLIREACRHLDRLGFTYAAVERSKHRGFISVGRFLLPTSHRNYGENQNKRM